MRRAGWRDLADRFRIRREWIGIGLGLAVLAVAVFLDSAINESLVLVAAYAVAAFVPAAFGTRVGTVVVATVVMLAAVSGREWNPGADAAELRIQVVLCFIGNLLALHVAGVRHEALRGFDRLNILTNIAKAVNTTASGEDTLRIVESILVPAFADFYMIDRVYHGGGGEVVIERASVSVAGPRAAEILPRLKERTSSVPRELVTGETVHGTGAVPTGSDDVMLISPVTEARLREIAHGPDDLEFLRSLNMNSYLHVTLQARGEVLGVITMAVAWSGRRYNRDDADFAQVLAGRIALALDNAGLFSHLRRIERRLDTAMEVLDEAVVIHERGGRLVFANAAAARLFGLESRDQLTDASDDDISRWCKFYDENDRPIAYEDMGELRATASSGGRAPEILRVEIGPERREVWLRPRVKAVMDADGEPLFAVTALEDVTEIKRAELEQTLLGRSGELLAAADDYEGVLRLIARLLVPMAADCCTVDMLDPDGDWRRVARVHRDPESVAAAGEGEGSRLEIDLHVGGRRAGIVTLENDPGNRELTEVDRRLATRFLERAAIALEKARLAADRAEIAASLQHGLIPPPLPATSGWEVAAVYHPAGELNEVGGDFYESFRTDDGQVVVIGDVVGRGARAASITAQARYTLHTAGQLSHDPAAALTALSRALHSRDDNPLCSAIALVLKDDAQHMELMIAGHPAPLKVGAEKIVPVGITGPILGAFENSEWPKVRVALEPGECLVLYTDGVTESEAAGDRFGDERLIDALREPYNGAELLLGLERRLEDFVAGPPRDDVAALAITTEQPLPGRPWPGRHLIERMYDAFNRRALDEMISFTDPDIELELSTAAKVGHHGPYTGYEGLRQFLADARIMWDDLLITPHLVNRYGEWILVRGRAYARSAGSGLKDVPAIWLWQLRGDRVYKGLAFVNLDRALSFAHTAVG